MTRRLSGALTAVCAVALGVHAHAQTTTTYRYDAHGRLEAVTTSTSRGIKTAEYGLDATGNRVRLKTSNGASFESRQSLPAMLDAGFLGHVTTASSQWDNAHAARLAFDQHGSHFGMGSLWASGGGPFPHWLQRRLPASAKVYAYRITNRGDGWNDQDPSAWQLQGSNDGNSWTTLDSRSGVTWWAQAQTHTFTLPEESRGYFTHYRLWVTAASGSPVAAVSELELLQEVEPIESTQSLPAMTGPSSEASASSQWDGAHSAHLAFDQNGSNFGWGSIWASNGGAFPQWVQRSLPGMVKVATYRITNRTDCCFDQAPSAWHFQGSNDGVSWTTLDSRSGVTWPGHPLRQAFTLPEASRGAFSHYRLLFTAASGSTVVTISELELLQ